MTAPDLFIAVNEMAKKALFQLANKGLLPSVGTEHWCRGVLQSIGFKEFEDFLQLSPSERDSPNGQIMLNEAIEKMKIATRQYARRQVCLFFSFRIDPQGLLRLLISY